MSSAKAPASPAIPPAPVLLQRLISGYVSSQVIYVAAKLRIADHLVAGPQTAGELARVTQSHGPSLKRFLRALTSLAVFTEDDEGRFGLGPLGHLLRTDTDRSLHAFAVHNNEETYRAWGEALHSALTGEPAFQHLYGKSFYEYMAEHPAANELWNLAMDQTERSFAIQMGIVQEYDWKDVRSVVDVGGGVGTLVAAILQSRPEMEGAVFDLPHVVAGAGPVLARHGVAGRTRVMPGDFFEAVPEGADLYLLSRVLFNWDDGDAIRILRNCRRAMSSEARLLVIEPVIRPGNRPDPRKMIDLNVFLMCGGRARTEPEHRALLKEAGFRLSRFIRTRGGSFDLVEAKPVPSASAMRRQPGSRT